ncbi:MAG TPA: alpha/beta hydrolase-fold protein [Marmoricola sp.]|nr:alpha/beta hydrolase-fold protein [Marmoricola sp.]
MSLTGPLFLGGIIVVTLAAFVGVVILWPRLTPGTPWRLAGRVGALALVNVLVVLVAATQLNASFLFFASWGDLQGALTGHLVQTSVHRGGADAQAPNIKVRGHVASVAATVPALPKVGSSGLLTYTVHGALSGLTGTVLVQLPPGYTSAAASADRYPVIEAFHGYPSNPLNLVKIFHLGQAVAARAQAHELHPSIVVMPQIEIPKGVDTEGVNGGPGQPQIDTWLTRDVPEWVGQNFRVIANRNAWATFGYSAGGFVAAMATTLHPAQYGAGIVMGGYFRPQFGPFYEPFTSTSPMGRYYDLASAVTHRPPPVSLWVETSHADPLSYKSSATFLHSVKAPTAVHAVILQNAGHRDSVWISLLPDALRWLGKNVQGFRP